MKRSSVYPTIVNLRLLLCLVLVCSCVKTARAQNFSDDFTRETYSTDVSPWQVFVGNWVITNGVFLGGPNTLNSYGNTYVTNNLTNFTVNAKFAFATNAYGGGLGARVNPASGAHYAAWIYPENSAGGSRALKLIKFTDWDSFSQLGATVTLPAAPGVGTNFHTLTMVLDTNLISVYFDGNLQMSFADSPTNYYTNGGISLDMYTFTPTAYVLSVDDVIAAPINYPPVSRSDRFTLGNGVQVINAPGVLYNDSDPESNSLAAILVNAPTNGTLNLAGNGSFTYTLTNSLSAYDAFTYRASDGVSTSAVATVLLTLTSNGIFFADDMSRATNPASLLPWTARAGNWSITNSVLVGGTNSIPSYGSLYTAGDWDDYAVEASFAFATNGYGGGIAGRMNPATGHRYAAWLYPENSDRGPNNVRIVKFQSWDAYGYNNFSNAVAIATVHLETPVGTNWHTLKLAFKTNLLSVYHNGNWLTNVGDFDVHTNRYLKGGLAVDFFSYTNTYQLLGDNVVARPLVCNDSYVAGEETQLTIAAPGLLTNDTGISGELLTTALVSGPANGTLNLSTNGSFTYTPATNFIGIDTFAYEVREGTNSVGAAIVQITVNSANDAPQLPSHPDYFVGSGSTILITNAASDPGDVPANVMSYQIASAPNGVTISTNGVISWTPTLAQSPSTNIIQTIVTDDGIPPLSDTNFITVVVTNPPGIYYEYAFYENFDGVSQPGLPAGWTTSQTGGQLIWFTQTAQRDSIPNAAFSSEASTNGINELVTPSILLPAGNFQLHFRNRYDLEDHPSNDGLAFDGGVLEIKIGAGAFVDVIAAGGTFLSGGYTHVISSDFGNPLAGRSAWSGDSAGFITTILALPSAASGQTVQFRWRCATDDATGGNGWAVDNVGLTNVLCCNLFAPVLPSQSNTSIAENTLITITNTATDGDLPSDHLTYALTTSPVGATITTNGIIAWQPIEAQGPMVGTFTTVVTDKAGLKATNTFNVTVLEVNVAPSFVVTPGNTNINEGTTLTVTNSATDLDQPANVLTYSLVGAPSGASITTNGVITWTPGEAQGPSTNVLVSVVSDGTVSVTNSFTVIVLEVNAAPTLPAQTNYTIAELTLLTVTNTASDIDVPTNTLTYSLLVAPTNAVISSNGIITWTPTEAQGPSTNVFTAKVTDGLASATNTFTVTVTEVNLAPVATNDSYFLTNAVLTVAAAGILANDSDADLPANTLTAVLVNNPTNGVLSLSSNGGFTYTPNVGFSGVDVFTYRATDGIATSAVATVSITVSNRPFIITSVAVNSGLATVTWNSTPGLSYRVQYLDNLNSTNWTDVNPIVTATNISASVTNFVGSNPQRFYRVKVTEAPQPVILSLQVTNGNAVITWSSVANLSYRLQYKTNLMDVAWTEVTPSITATAATTTTTNAVGATAQRLFRIRLMP